MLIAAVENGQSFWLVIAAVLFAAVSAYYYFRVIQAIYFKEPSLNNDIVEITPVFKGLLIVTSILIIIVGIYPEFILGWIFH